MCPLCLCTPSSLPSPLSPPLFLPCSSATALGAGGLPPHSGLTKAWGIEGCLLRGECSLQRSGNRDGNVSQIRAGMRTRSWLSQSLLDDPGKWGRPLYPLFPLASRSACGGSGVEACAEDTEPLQMGGSAATWHLWSALGCFGFAPCCWQKRKVSLCEASSLWPGLASPSWTWRWGEGLMGN